MIVLHFHQYLSHSTWTSGQMEEAGQRGLTFGFWKTLSGPLSPGYALKAAKAATFAPAPETQVEEQAVSPEPSAPVRHGMSFLELYRGASILRPSLLQRAGHIYGKTSAMSRQHGNTIHFQG